MEVSSVFTYEKKYFRENFKALSVFTVSGKYWNELLHPVTKSDAFELNKQ